MKHKTQSSSAPRLLTIKELAAELKDHEGRSRSRGYVHAMKARGFKMPNRKATLESALAFLAKNPGFTWRSVYRP